MYFALSLVEHSPAISTPIMKPKADKVKDEPAMVNETSYLQVCHIERGLVYGQMNYLLHE